MRARNRESTSGPSLVLLPDLASIGDCTRIAGSDERERVQEGELVQQLLQQHNAEALRLLVAYCHCFAEAHRDQLGDDHTLPVTGCGPSQTLPVGEAFVEVLGQSWSSWCNSARCCQYLSPFRDTGISLGRCGSCVPLCGRGCIWTLKFCLFSSFTTVTCSLIPSCSTSSSTGS